MSRLILLLSALSASMLLAAPVPKPSEKELMARWGEIVKGVKEDAGTPKDGTLILTSSAREKEAKGVLNSLPILDSVRTRTTMKGDFVVTVRLRAVELVTPAPKDRKWDEWRIGLYFRDSTATVANSWNSPIQTPYECPIELIFDSSGGLVKSRATIAMGGEDQIWLRLSRSDGTIAAAFGPSLEKLEERELTEWLNGIPMGDELEVGLYIQPREGKTIRATFSDFKLTTGKQ